MIHWYVVSIISIRVTNYLCLVCDARLENGTTTAEEQNGNFNVMSISDMWCLFTNPST